MNYEHDQLPKQYSASISDGRPAGAGSGAGASSQADGPSFKDFLLNSIQQVNSMQQDADKAVEDMFTGGNTDPATVLTAVQKADMAFRMLMQVRNKLSTRVRRVQEHLNLNHESEKQICNSSDH